MRHLRAITWSILASLIWLGQVSVPASAQDAGQGATAQDVQPLVEYEVSATEVVPGQPVVFRVTVLVPTWLPKPVAFPSLEAPNLMVKLLDRSTTPTSRTIDGDTWSGVTRSYRLSPMVPGPVQVPGQELTIYWAEPGNTDPLVSKIAADPLILTGIVPTGAEDLDPFVAATGVTLTETLSSDQRSFKPGDSLTRTVTAEIAGTSPLFLPPLLQSHTVPGFASYPDEPVVTETADRTWLAGTREESVTMVAESGGSGAVPAVELRWFNLDTNTVETARIEGFEVTVDGPVARKAPEVDPQTFALIVAGVIVVALCGWGIVKWAWPKWRDWRADRRAAFRATERWAYRKVGDAVAARNYTAFVQAYDQWKKRLPAQTPSETQRVDAALADLGACLFGGQGDPKATKVAWKLLADSVTRARQEALSNSDPMPGLGQLAPLNPE